MELTYQSPTEIITSTYSPMNATTYDRTATGKSTIVEAQSCAYNYIFSNTLTIIYIKVGLLET